MCGLTIASVLGVLLGCWSFNFGSLIPLLRFPTPRTLRPRHHFPTQLDQYLAHLLRRNRIDDITRGYDLRAMAVMAMWRVEGHVLALHSSTSSSAHSVGDSEIS